MLTNSWPRLTFASILTGWRQTLLAVRLLLTDTAWAEIEPRLAAIKHQAGSPPELRDRLCLEAVLDIARPGMPWRDMPREVGRWEAGYHRFRRWDARGLWRQLWACGPRDGCHVAQHRFIESPMMRAPPPAAGARKKPAGKGHRLWAALGVDSPPTAMPAVSMQSPVSPSRSPAVHARRRRPVRWSGSPGLRCHTWPMGSWPTPMTVPVFARISRSRR